MFKSKAKTKPKSKPAPKAKKAKKPGRLRVFFQSVRAWSGDPRVQAVHGVLILAGSIRTELLLIFLIPETVFVDTQLFSQ